MADSTPGWDAYARGMRLGWDFRYTDADMAAFRRLSGDHNPIHTDAAFAQAKGYKAPLVYGLLLSTSLSRLVGQELPDTNAILIGISMKFSKPAFVDEDLRFDAELADKSDATHTLHFKCRISRANVTLCSGTADALWRA